MEMGSSISRGEWRFSDEKEGGRVLALWRKEKKRTRTSTRRIADLVVNG
jgi:hypothetical protein